MNQAAEEYAKLVLAVGQHDPDYVDAFYGPALWRTEAERARRPLAALHADADALLRDLGKPSLSAGSDELATLRHRYLVRQTESVRDRIRMLNGTKLTFDEESRALYDAEAPRHPESYFRATLDELEKRLPGRGPLIDRFDAFRAAFVIPTDRLARVFDAALAECRTRTAMHIELPPTESFTFELVTNKPWSGYNWYQGSSMSLIQVNTDLPIYIDRAIDLACHEGYPGHHVYNALLEKHLVRDRGWMEYTVYALFSPQSLIAEGTANYGIEVAFPGETRTAFEQAVLFPLAGLDASRAASYYEIQTLVEQLSYAGNEAARRYLNGEIDHARAAAWLAELAMMSPARATQRLAFIDTYRSYVINYNLGKDLVKQYIESAAGPDNNQRWTRFAALLSSPRLPSGLRTRP